MLRSTTLRHALLAVCLAATLALCGCGEPMERERERELQVKVVDPEGRILRLGRGEEVGVFLEDPVSGDLHSWSPWHGDDGSFHLIQRQEHVRLEIMSPGCRPVSITDPQADTEVRLQYGIPVRIRVHVEGELPEPPLSLELQVYAADEEHRDLEQLTADEAWFQSPHRHRAHRIVVTAAECELKIWFPWAGRYEISWMLYTRNDIRTPTHTSLGGFGSGPGKRSKITIEVEDRADQSFDYRVTADHLARTLKHGK